MIEPKPASKDTCYEIKILGQLDERWSGWFTGLSISSVQAQGEMPITTLAVRVPDQARLRGILNKIWDLNLTLISVITIEVTQFRE